MARKKKSTDDQIKDENINESDDNFGLPEIEYEPLNREDEPVQNTVEYKETRTETSYSETTSETPVDESENNSSTLNNDEELEAEEREKYNDYVNRSSPSDQSMLPKVVGFILVLALAGAAGWYFLIYQPKQKEAQERAYKEAQLKRDAEKLAEDQREAERRRIEDEQRKADSLANAKPAIGTIEALEGRTGRYYVVVASAIDDDLIMDYAKELSAKGVSTKIIPPFGKTKFSRIAVSEGDTYADAQTIADGLKAEYGEGAWVVKY